MKKEEDPVVVEQSFHTSIDSVWKALTDVNRMRQWFFDNIPAFKPEVGFETQFNVQSESRDFLHMWKVVEVVPQKLIKLNWKYDGYPGDSFVLFEIFNEGNWSKLRLTAQVLEDFPDDIPEFKRESCSGGWTYFINRRLKEFLK